MMIESLRVFVDIIETKSFSKAAARNQITQPAVSQQVKTLEEHFQQKLIERSPQGIYPTEAGHLFYQEALAIVERFQNMEQQMMDLTNRVVGTVRVATVYSVGLHDLPPYVKRFMQTYPQAHIHLEYSRTNKIYDAVRQNQVDIGIVAYPEESHLVGVIALPSDQLVLVVSPTHPLAKHVGPIEFEQLRGEPFVVFVPDMPTGRAVLKIMQDRGVEVTIVQEFDNVEMIKRSVEADIGISIIPRRTAQLEVNAGSLVALSIANVALERPVGVIYKRGRSFSKTLEKFIGVLTGADEFRAPLH